MILSLIGALVSTTPVIATVQSELEQIAQVINQIHNDGPVKIGNAIVTNNTLTADIVSTVPVLSDVEAAKSQVRQMLCAKSFLKNLPTLQSVQMRFILSAPDLLQPIIITVRPANCGIASDNALSVAPKPLPMVTRLATSGVANNGAARVSPKHLPVISHPTSTRRQMKALFEFKGVTAGQSVDMSLLRDCVPNATSPEETECNIADGRVAGIDLVAAPAIQLYKGKLATLSFLFAGPLFPTYSSAFEAKYGKSCRFEHPKWQNRAGATFDNTVVTWCFTTGELQLTEMSVQQQIGLVTYTDTLNKVPAASAKIDF